MDLFSHLMSGAIVAFASDMTPLQRGLTIAGSVLPDIVCPFYYRALVKKAGKKIEDLTEEDSIKYQEEIQPWMKIYRGLHSFLFLGNIFVLELFFFNGAYFSRGWLIHLLYDLFTHHYPENMELGPKPLYPLFKWVFPWGLTNGWKMLKEKEGLKYQKLTWFIHAIILAFVLLREYLV